MTTWFYILVNSSTLELISLSILATCLLDIVQRWCLEKFHVKCFFSCMNVTQWHKSDQQIASPGRIKQRDNGNLDLNQPKDICSTSELNNKVQNVWHLRGKIWPEFRSIIVKRFMFELPMMSISYLSDENTNIFKLLR